jgi:hypothetical protein
MPASLLTADNYLPIPDGAKFFTKKEDDVYYSLNGALSFSFFNRIVSIGRNYRDNADAAFQETNAVKTTAFQRRSCAS